MIDGNIGQYLNRIGDMPSAFGSTRTLVKQISTISGYDLNRGEMVYAKREDRFYFGLELERTVELAFMEVEAECCPVPLVQDVPNYTWSEGDCCFLHDQQGNFYYINSLGEVVPVSSEDEIYQVGSEIYTTVGGLDYGLSGRKFTYIGHTLGPVAGQFIPASGTDVVQLPRMYWDSWDDLPSPQTGANLPNNSIITPTIPSIPRNIYLITAGLRWTSNAWGEIRPVMTFNGNPTAGQTSFSYPARGNPNGTTATVSAIYQIGSGVEIGMNIDNATNGGMITTASLAVTLVGR